MPVRVFIELDGDGTEEVPIALSELDPGDSTYPDQIADAIDETLDWAWPFLSHRVKRQFRVARGSATRARKGGER